MMKNIQNIHNLTSKWTKNLAFIVLMITSIMLIACQKPVETSNTETANKTTEETSDISVSKIKSEPMVYPISTWQQQKSQKIALTDIDAIKKILGKLERTDNNSLDYKGNLAKKYSFQPESSPYLDLIDSEKYLELGWYYANSTDNETEKQISIEHAGKIYQIAQGLFEKSGETLVADMLNGKVVKEQTFDDKFIELAKCEFFSCMLIIKK